MAIVSSPCASGVPGSARPFQRSVGGTTSAVGASGAWSITAPGIGTTLLSCAPCTTLRAVRSYGGRSLPVRCPRTLRRRRKMKTASARKMMV